MFSKVTEQMSTQRGGGTETGKFDCSIGAEGGDGILGGLVPEDKHLLGPILSSSRLRG